jgi:hypothetical protein
MAIVSLAREPQGRCQCIGGIQILLWLALVCVLVAGIVFNPTWIPNWNSDKTTFNKYNGGSGRGIGGGSNVPDGSKLTASLTMKPTQETRCLAVDKGVLLVSCRAGHVYVRRYPLMSTNVYTHCVFTFVKKACVGGSGATEMNMIEQCSNLPSDEGQL